MTVRLKDIAADLGLSIVTVSKALRNEGRMSPETRERVLQRAKELDYHPNWTARGLVSGRTFLVGLIVPDLVHPFFAVIAKQVAARLRPKGYTVVIASSEEVPEIEEQEVETLVGRGVDALILASTQRSARSPLFRLLAQHQLPYVLIDRKVRGLAAHFIGGDDEQVGRLATQHLLDRGYRRIAHIRGPRLSTGDRRFRGYARALEERGILPDPDLVVSATAPDERGETSGYESMQLLLARRARPDAVFCYNDITASGAARAILDRGLRIPNDVAVMGTSNLAGLARWSTTPVPLSTVDQNAEEIGTQAADLLTRLLDSPDTIPPAEIIVPQKLVLRSST